MGRDRYHVGDPAALHFLTCTALLWLPLFAQPATARILLASLQFPVDRACGNLCRAWRSPWLAPSTVPRSRARHSVVRKCPRHTPIPGAGAPPASASGSMGDLGECLKAQGVYLRRPGVSPIPPEVRRQIAGLIPQLSGVSP